MYSLEFKIRIYYRWEIKNTKIKH